MNYKQVKYLCFLFILLIITIFLMYSGLLNGNSPIKTVDQYYSALQTHQEGLAARLLEEFDWRCIESISQKSIVEFHGRASNLRKKHGSITGFQIINTSISGNLAEIHLKIKWDDKNEAIDKVKLSNKTGKWKIVSAEVYY